MMPNPVVVIVVMFMLVADGAAQVRAPFYGNVCSREERACGVYPVTNATEHTLLQTFLFQSGPAVEGYTIYISPFAVSCTPPFCWRPNPTTVDPGERYVWNTGPLLVDIDGLKIKSAFPNVADPRVQIHHDETTVQTSQSLTLGCSSMLITAADVSVEDMYLTIDQSCVDWIDSKKESNIGDFAGIIYSTTVLGGISISNVELSGGLVTLMIVPTETYPILTTANNITLSSVVLSSPVTGLGRAQAALLYRVESPDIHVIDSGQASAPVIYLTHNITISGTSVAYNLSYELPPNGLSVVDPATTSRVIVVDHKSLQTMILAGVWCLVALLAILLTYYMYKWIVKNESIRSDESKSPPVGIHAAALGAIRQEKSRISDHLLNKMTGSLNSKIDPPVSNVGDYTQDMSEETKPTGVQHNANHRGARSRKPKKPLK